MFDQIVSIRNLRGFTAIQKSILLNIATRLGKNLTAWPSVDRLSLDVGCSRRTLQQNLRHLASAGVLQIFEKSDGRSSNRYRLTLPAPSADEVDLLKIQYEQTGGRRLSAEELALLQEADGVSVQLDPAPNQMSFSWSDDYVPETGASGAPVQRESCAPAVQQMRPKEQVKKNQKQTLHVGLNSDSSPVHRSPSLLRREHSKKPLPRQRELLWKDLTDELLEQIVAANQLSEFRRYDAEGCRAFGWNADFGASRERWASWKSSVSYAKRQRASGGSASSAAVLKSALIDYSGGDRTKLSYMTDDQVADARVQLVDKPLPASSGVGQAMCRLQLATASVADPSRDSMESWQK